ncbi:MAG: 4-(cytidine 5'-diphospho)-2-C-methyl-D-erythritol kinase [Holdemanella sp.]|nr:4-(cytidine 5'-diphospho)-2-C-methyl-D-erythritol kinase [Holdemanella sp.]
MKIYAPAKVNLALDIVGQDERGYHLLDMIMVPISVYDELEISYSDADSILCKEMKIPEVNTMSRMVKLLKETFSIEKSFKIEVVKHIPMEAGLAGGSADAAAVMKAILEMEHISIPIERQIELAKQIGADVPFCLVNRWSRVQGIGEIIRPLDCEWKFKALLVKPAVGISTPVAFKKWHEMEPLKVNVDVVEDCILKKDPISLFQSMENTLEPVARTMEPILEEIKEMMTENGIERVLMSGSGSSMIGFSIDEDILIETKNIMEKKYPFVEIITIG